MATKLQFNRDWTWENIKDWLNYEVEDQSSARFYSSQDEATSATDTRYNTYYSLQGDNRKIIYDAPSGGEPSEEIKISGNGLTITGVNLKIV